MCFFLFFCIEFIEVALVNKIIQVSGVQFYKTSSVYCIVCSPPQVKSPSTTIYPLIPSSNSPHPPFLLVTPHWCQCLEGLLWGVVCLFAFCFISSPFSPSCSNHSPLTAVSLFSLSLFLFCLLISLCFFNYKIVTTDTYPISEGLWWLMTCVRCTEGLDGRPSICCRV